MHWATCAYESAARGLEQRQQPMTRSASSSASTDKPDGPDHRVDVEAERGLVVAGPSLLAHVVGVLGAGSDPSVHSFANSSEGRRARGGGLGRCAPLAIVSTAAPLLHLQTPLRPGVAQRFEDRLDLLGCHHGTRRRDARSASEGGSLLGGIIVARREWRTTRDPSDRCAPARRSRFRRACGRCRSLHGAWGTSVRRSTEPVRGGHQVTPPRTDSLEPSFAPPFLGRRPLLGRDHRRASRVQRRQAPMHSASPPRAGQPSRESQCSRQTWRSGCEVHCSNTKYPPGTCWSSGIAPRHPPKLREPVYNRPAQRNADITSAHSQFNRRYLPGSRPEGG